jgi:hypothetical protein
MATNSHGRGVVGIAHRRTQATVMSSYWMATSKIFTRRALVTKINRGWYKITCTEVDILATPPFAVYREAGVRFATSEKAARIIAKDYIDNGNVLNNQLELPGMPATKRVYD